MALGAAAVALALWTWWPSPASDPSRAPSAGGRAVQSGQQERAAAGVGGGPIAPADPAALITQAAAAEQRSRGSGSAQNAGAVGGPAVAPPAAVAGAPGVAAPPPAAPAATGVQRTSDGLVVSTAFALVGGDVVLDGQPAPDGTEVQALCRDGTVCGVARVREGGGLGPGQFRMTVFGADGRDTTAAYAHDGDAVAFTVAGRPADPDPPYKWRVLSGEVFRLLAKD